MPNAWPSGLSWALICKAPGVSTVDLSLLPVHPPGFKDFALFLATGTSVARMAFCHEE